MNSGLTFSFSAIFFIIGVISPLRAVSIMVLISDRLRIVSSTLKSQSVDHMSLQETSVTSRPLRLSANPLFEKMTSLRSS